MKKVLDTGTCSAVFVSEAPSGTAHAASSSTGPATGASVVCIGSDRGALRRTGGGGSGTNRRAVPLGTGEANQPTDTSAGKVTTAGPNAYGMPTAWEKTNVEQLNNTLVHTGAPPGYR